MTRLKALQFVAGIFFIICCTFLSTAYADNGYIEFSQTINPNTFDSVRTMGLFSRGINQKDEIVYGGLQLSSFEMTDGYSELYRVLIGVSSSGKIAPFFEIGTDLLGFLTAGNTESDCGSNACNILHFIRAGVRFNFVNRYSIGLYHENITFGDRHRVLDGDHYYNGFSLSYGF